MSVKVMGMVWDIQTLHPTLKYVLVCYADHADHEGENVWPSIGLISDKTGLAERTIQRSTRKLSDLGWLVADGQGKNGTNKWRIPLDKGGDRVTPPIDRGDIHDTKGVTESPLGVTESPERGDRESPEPSLTIKEPSKEPSLNGKEKNAVRKSAEIDFKELTRLDHPARQSETNELWWTPLREICTLADWKPEVANWLIFESLQRLQKNGMTVSSPKSIIKTCRAIKAERDRGAFKQYNEPKGMTGLRSWLAQGA